MKFINSSVNFLKKYNSISCFILFLVLGLIFAFYPMFRSGFDLMMGSGVDPRLINYTLEHYWLNLSGSELHNSFWNLPVYYPLKNTLVLTDMVYGAFPFYLIFRLLKLNELSSFQLTYIAVSIANYFCYYYLLKKVFKFQALSSAIGSFIFSFSLMRIYRLTHFNYFIQFYSVLALIFLAKLKKHDSFKKKLLYSTALSIALFFQLISNITLIYFLFLIGFILIITALFFKDLRLEISDYFKKNHKFLIYSFVLFLILSFETLLHYLLAPSIPRGYDELLYFTPDFSAWLYNISRINQMFFIKAQAVNPFKFMESSVGLGLITSIITVLGLCKLKNKSLKISFSIVIVLGIIFSCKFFDFLPWTYLYYILPFASKIRAIVRISFILLIIFAFLIANYFETITNSDFKYKKPLIIISVLLIILEHIPFYNVGFLNWKGYDWSKKEYVEKIDKISSAIKDKCEVIECEPVNINLNIKPDFFQNTQAILNAKTDCMFIASSAQMYSASGYSGSLIKEQYVPNKKYCFIKIPYDFKKFN